MKIKKAVVTGASGFIGHHLVRELMERDVDVAIVTRYDNVVKNERLRPVWGKLHRIEADLRHRDPLHQIRVFRPDVVFHLAAYNQVLSSFRQVEECYDINAKGAANVLDVIDGQCKVVYVSSSEVYGHQHKCPWNEDMAPKPQSPYAITKYAGELHAIMHQRLGNPVIVVRPFNVFGPYQSSKAVIPDFIIRALEGIDIQATEGRQTREFNYVDDIVEGMVDLAELDDCVPGPTNLGCGSDIEIRHLLDMIVRLSESKSKVILGAHPTRPNEIWKMACDNRRAKKLIAWDPNYSLTTGLKRTIEWYRNNRGLMK